MNEKERQVMGFIKENPYLSQQEMADRLNMSRPTLANLISSLIKRGEIIGRGYVLRETTEVIAVGGANVDRKFHIEGLARFGTSNPATVSYSVGGVARNIAENLGRLNQEVQIVTVLGQDHDADLIKHDSSAFLKFDYTEYLHNEATGSYSAVLNNNGELVVAMANMAIYDQLLPELISKNELAYQKASAIVVDLNCPKETVMYFKSIAKQYGIPFVIVPVSSPKMNRMPDELSGVTYLICNEDETETYLKREMKTDADVEEALNQFLALGAQHVIITLGSRGIFAANGETIKHFAAYPIDRVADVTGAGDAFVSGFIYGAINNEPFEDAISLGLVNAARTLQSDKTVRIELTADELTNWRKKL